MGDHLLRQQDGWKVPTPTSASSPLELMIELMAAKPFIPKKLAERVGFYYRRYLQVRKNTTLPRYYPVFERVTSES
jgi:hypothetical protein